MGLWGRKLTLRPGNKLCFTWLVCKKDGLICLFGTVMCLAAGFPSLVTHWTNYWEGYSFTWVPRDHGTFLFNIHNSCFLFVVFKFGLRWFLTFQFILWLFHNFFHSFWISESPHLFWVATCWTIIFSHHFWMSWLLCSLIRTRERVLRIPCVVEWVNWSLVCILCLDVNIHSLYNNNNWTK